MRSCGRTPSSPPRQTRPLSSENENEQEIRSRRLTSCLFSFDVARYCISPRSVPPAFDLDRPHHRRRSGVNRQVVLTRKDVAEIEAAVGGCRRRVRRGRHEDARPHRRMNVAGHVVIPWLEFMLVLAESKRRHVEHGFLWRSRIRYADVVEHVFAVAELHRLASLGDEKCRQELVASLVHDGRRTRDRQFGPGLRLEHDQRPRRRQRRCKLSGNAL